MQVEEIKTWLLANGWKEDRYGHFQKETESKRYRMKFQAQTVRFEVRIVMPHDAPDEWVRVASGYYKAVKIIEQGKYMNCLLIGTHALRPYNAAQATITA